MDLLCNISKKTTAKGQVPQAQHHKLPSYAVQRLSGCLICSTDCGKRADDMQPDCLAAKRCEVHVGGLPAHPTGVVGIAKLGAKSAHDTSSTIIGFAHVALQALWPLPHAKLSPAPKHVTVCCSGSTSSLGSLPSPKASSSCAAQLSRTWQST